MDEFVFECFLAVVESGSMTGAALKVKRTQSAVTQRISSLEKLIGKRLFDRDKQMRLTKDGEIFLHYANKMRALHWELLDRLKHPELEGEVRFGVPEDFAAMLLSDVLTEFARLHPRVLVNVECDLTLNLFERFKKGAFDMVLVKMNRPEDFPYGVEVWSEPLEWVGKGDSVLFHDRGDPLPLVLSPEPCVYRAKALEALEKAGIRWKIVFISPSYAGIVAAVNAGMGITTLPRTMIPSGLQLLKDPRLPSLPDIHVSLLKQADTNVCFQSLEEFLLKKLNAGL